MKAPLNVETATNAELDAKVLDVDAGQGAVLLRDVHAFLGRFIAYPSAEAQDAHALWIAHTHLMDCWDTTPRLAFMSKVKGSGKSRALEITAQLTPGGLLSVGASPASIVRLVAHGGVTVNYDEVDAIFGSTKREEANLDIRSIINAGYRRGAQVHRCIAIGNRFEVEKLDAFAPFAMAGLRELPDTVASRSVIIQMRKRAPDEKIEPYRLRIHSKDAARLYDRLEAWAREQPQEIAWPKLPEEIQDRDADVWEPLIAVAELVGGEWPQRAREVALHFVRGGRDESMSPDVELLLHIKEAFGQERQLWTRTLLGRLHERPESPWNDIRGKPLDDRGLAHRLKGFRIKSRDVKLNEVNCKGYRAEDFDDAWRRYLPPLEGTSATSATSATNLNNQNKKVAQVALVALVALNERKCTQCNLDDGQTAVHDIGGGKVWLHRECVQFYCKGH